MMTTRLRRAQSSRRLRDPQGWNAGLFKALALPDGAFKLYVWLRLNARLDTGALEISQLDLARALKKARGTIRASLNELERAGVCRIKFPRASLSRGRIEITDDYWPYERTGSETDDPELRSYLERIRELLGERACVRNSLRTADELLARQWYARGVSPERIGQAILLGCARLRRAQSSRKYVSWRNGAPPVPVGSLRYFEPILAELDGQQVRADYWDYTRHRIERMEKLWINGKGSDERADSDPPTRTKTQNGGISEHGPELDR